MNMADNYYACAHVKVDGEDVYSPVNKYSVLQYAYNMLGKAEKTATNDVKLKNLLNTMLDYGSNVQLYADYKTERLSNDKWYYVKVNGGTLEDGFDHGLYLKDDEITVTLNDGESFSYWTDISGNELSDKKSFKITVSDLLGNDEKTVITISAELKASEGLVFTSRGNGTCYVSGIGTCTDTDIVIPKTSPKGDKVTGIGYGAFEGCTSLTNITIPDSVTSISGNAFWYTAYYNNNENWTDGVLYIGNHLIEAKTSISGAYTIKNGTKCIADEAFEYCRSLTSITIPNSVTSIGYLAFYNCTSLTSIDIPDGVTSIDNFAFSYCTSLTSVTIGKGVTSIGSGAFNKFTSLKKVYYKGTANEWSKISIDNSFGYNSYLTNATRYYYSETEPATSGNWWHYDANGNVTEW